MIIIDQKEEILSKAADLLSDESKFVLGTPSAVYFPENEDELQDLMKVLSQQNSAITFSGAKTGITGGSVPTDESVIISFSKLNKIRNIEIRDNTAILTCESGITLSEINNFLKDPNKWPYFVEGSKSIEPDKWFYAPDPTEMTAQLGGTIATNASGARSYKYGATRDSVISLILILSTGEKISISKDDLLNDNSDILLETDSGRRIEIPRTNYNSPILKNAAGYFSSPSMNAIDLFIGSEGTLAAISSATIILQKKNTITAGLSFFPGYKQAFSYAQFLRSREETIAIEYFDETTFPLLNNNKEMLVHKLPAFPKEAHCAIYWEYSAKMPFIENYKLWNQKLEECDSSLDLTWSGYTDKEKVLLKQFRHSVPEVINSLIGRYKKKAPGIRKVSSDTSVPAKYFLDLYEHYIDLIKSENLTFAAFGHLGDYHLHFNIIPKNENEMQKAQHIYKKMMTKAVELNGTVSAEHGIGKIKKEYLKLMYGENGISDMKRVKRVLDPGNQLNPETLF